MIPAYIYDRIVELDGDGWSYRTIAASVGMSIGTVSKVVNQQLERIKDPDEFHEVSTYRCRGCGILVRLKPCLNCKVNEP